MSKLVTFGKGKSELLTIIKFYCFLLLILYFKIGLFDYICYDQFGRPYCCVSDYAQYYSASILTRNGEAISAYDFAKLNQVAEAATGQKITRLAWNYPPTFFLLVLPLSFVPYAVSLFLWLLVTFIPYLLVLYRIAPARLTFWLATLFPATVMNFNHGQNGFLFTSLLGGGLLLLNHYPLTAGIFFGLLTCKPHFAIIIPVALVAGRKWKVLGSMVVTLTVMVILSTALFGWDTWRAFFENAPFIRKLLETGTAPWFKMPTPFVSARMVGFNVNISYTLQAIIAVSMIGMVYYVWSQKKEAELSNSILVLGILLATPYALVHDLTILAIPMAYISWQGHTKGWFPFEKYILAAVWHMPLYSMFIALFTANLQIAPLILIIHLIFIFWRFNSAGRFNYI